MIVLGLFGFGMNPGACLLVDGRPVAAAEEERFVRVKGAPGLFPGRSVRSCLRQAGTTLSEVDRIAFAWDAGKYPYRMLRALAGQYLKYRPRVSGARGGDTTFLTAVSNLLQYTPGRLREEIRLGLRAHGLEGDCPPIEFVPHHLAHAASTFFPSPFREALVLTVDGSGEDVCTQLAVGRGSQLRVVETIGIPHSLGWFYAAFTAYFGFSPYRHEGKLMGLAALGAERAGSNPWPERLERILRVTPQGYEVDPTFTRFGAHTWAERFTDALAELVTAHEPGLVPLLGGNGNGTDRSGPPRYLDRAYVDLAWGVQDALERAVQALARRAAQQHGLRHLCVAGGVGLNCKLNGALLAEACFDGLFVQPACHDAGTALGAAMLVAHDGGDDVRHPMAHARLGPGWTVEELRGELVACKVRAEECEDIADRVAAELASGRLVGWHQGRMELGPRALGARSILANPLEPDVRERLNREVKQREPWRPFCPSVLDERRDELLVDGQPAPFMTTAFRVGDAWRERAGAAVHVDGSVRPQTVRADVDPLYHRLIARFAERTGAPLVINTSFNVDGEPIVCTPREALRCFYASGLDALALGPFLLTKT